ncbi:hypothetical protein PFISCL1PPCAC_16713, partial [Pristionchus fissidentatus]
QDGLSQLFYEMGFDVQARENLTGQAMLDVVANFAASDEHKNTSSAFVFILSHGNSGTLEGVDGEFVNKHDVERKFEAHIAPALAKKPKVIVYQSCRGGQSDPGKYCDSSRVEEDLPLQDVSPEQRIPTCSGMLVAYSTADFHLSKRSRTGTRYIQQFIKTTRQYAHKEDILSILTRLRSSVWQECTTLANGKRDLHMQAPEFTSRLDKIFYFFPPDSFLPNYKNTNTERVTLEHSDVIVPFQDMLNTMIRNSEPHLKFPRHIFDECIYDNEN